LPDGFTDARVCLRVLAVRAPATGSQVLAKDFAAFCAAFQGDDPICAFRWWFWSMTVSFVAAASTTSCG